MKYSIITVNYNNKEGLRKTIESVVNQTFRDFEYIIIDGGSTDGSIEILKEYDQQIDYWISEKDSGIYNAMNKGIAKAKGEYLNFMNSGDCFFTPNILERVSDYQYDTDFIVGKDYHYNEKKKQGHASIHPSRTTMIHFFISTLDHQSCFIKKELFVDSVYKEDYQLVSDWIFFTEKIVSENKKVQFIPDIICKREEGGLSERQHEQNRKEINKWLHIFLPIGVYNDYITLARLDKTSLYRLFDIIENEKTRKILTIFIKILFRLFSFLNKFKKHMDNS